MYILFQTGFSRIFIIKNKVLILIADKDFKAQNFVNDNVIS